MGFLKNLFSLDSFKAEMKEELEKLRNENKELKRQVEEKQKEEPSKMTIATVNDKQYLSLQYDGINLTVVDLEGEPHSKPDATKDDVKAVRDAKTHEELVKIFRSATTISEQDKRKVNSSYLTEEELEVANLKQDVRKNENKAIISGYPLLSESGEFDVENDVVYLKGIRRSLPTLLVRKFAKIAARVVEEARKVNETKDLGERLNEDLEFLAHKRFTYWCFLAPYPEVLDKLYPFLEANGLKLTKEGFFLAIRNVVTVKGTKNSYADAITNAFTKIKTIWKKSPKNFELWEQSVGNETGYILKDLKKDKLIGGEEVSSLTLIGNLADLNDNIKEDDQVRYTDDYTKTFDIRLNKWVTTDPKNIVWASENCVGTGGLHFSLDSTGLCGDKSLLIAVNPMHVTSVGTYKATSWAYFPFMATEVYEARKLLLDQDFESFHLDFEKFDEKFNNLEELAKEGFKEHTKVEKFDVPVEAMVEGVLNQDELDLVTKTLEEMKTTLNKRVVEV